MKRVFFLAIAAITNGLLFAQPLRIAVASNFAQPAAVLAKQFTQETGLVVSLAMGSTGQFYTQIRQGAPFDVLLSADQATPSKLIDEGFAVTDTQFTYATGRLMLWSVDPNRINRGADALNQTNIKVAIADPKLAPYGAAAVQTLKALGKWEQVAAQIVQGNNITQAYQFVASGNAQLGFVAAAQVHEQGTIRVRQGSGWLIPQSLHEPLRQDAVVLKRSQTSASVSTAAAAFMQFLQSDKARRIIAAHGYETTSAAIPLPKKP